MTDFFNNFANAQKGMTSYAAQNQQPNPQAGQFGYQQPQQMPQGYGYLNNPYGGASDMFSPTGTGYNNYWAGTVANPDGSRSTGSDIIREMEMAAMYGQQQSGAVPGAQTAGAGSAAGANGASGILNEVGSKAKDWLFGKDGEKGVLNGGRKTETDTDTPATGTAKAAEGSKAAKTAKKGSWFSNIWNSDWLNTNFLRKNQVGEGLKATGGTVKSGLISAGARVAGMGIRKLFMKDTVQTGAGKVVATAGNVISLLPIPYAQAIGAAVTFAGELFAVDPHKQFDNKFNDINGLATKHGGTVGLLQAMSTSGEGLSSKNDIKKWLHSQGYSRKEARQMSRKLIKLRKNALRIAQGSEKGHANTGWDQVLALANRS